jgi:L-aspartate oxidase
LSEIIKSDYLVIGCGIAGLSYALKVADHGKVNLISKGNASETNTSYAQGGIASVTAKADSIEKHVEDTLIAGAGLCHQDAVKQALNEAPQRIQDLIDWGVEFTTNEKGEFDLAKEGGHSMHRILHAADLTGAEIQRALLEKARQHPNIELFENHVAIDIITEHHVLGNLQSAFNICFGAYILSVENNVVIPFQASFTTIATGGASHVFLHSTNPSIATGDGVAMAHRAGVRIANMEFVQFHPTALYNPGKRSFLISEALRGFGGRLVNSKGERFMTNYDSRVELAPRDIVARAIDSEMKRLRDDCVFLDMRHLESKEVKTRFPNITRYCKEALNIDISTQLIPVVPAAHYFCGGIMTSLSGQTSMQNLYAVGEAAHTGLHGANRLASNSLMEGLAFGHHAAMKAISKRPRNFGAVIIPQWDESGVIDEKEWVLIKHNMKEIQNIMWGYVGIVRSKKQLWRARRRIDVIYHEIEDYYKKSKVSEDLLELRSLATIAYLIIISALRRNESRGLHYMTDFPEKNDKYLKDTII